MNTMQKCLTLVDFQNDFVAPEGALTFDNGAGDPALIKRMNVFFDNLPKGYFDHGIMTYDTHDPKNYFDTEEAISFPLHCATNTRGWHLAINPLKVFNKIPNSQILKKTTYDMWAGTIDNVNPVFLQVPQDVTIIGVASDICNKAAMEGWLERGAKVTIIDDLTRGIFKETKEVVADDKYAQYRKAGKLRVINSLQFFREINNVNPRSQGGRP